MYDLLMAFSSFYNLKFKQQYLIAVMAAPLFLLVLLNLIVGLVPIYNENQVKHSIAEQNSKNYLDLIDYEMVERYGDVLSFAQSSEAISTASSNDFGLELGRKMNKLMENYPVYDMMWVVNLKGQVLACNYTDNNGSIINTASLYAKDFSRTDWFKAIVDNKKTVWYSDIKISSISKDLYKSDGLGVELSAPIKDSVGNIIGVWYNFCSWKKLIQKIRTDVLSSLNHTYPGSMMLMVNKENFIIDASKPSMILKEYFKVAQSIIKEGKNEFKVSDYLLGDYLETGKSFYLGQKWKCVTLIPKSQIHWALFFTPILILADLFVIITTIIIAYILSSNLNNRLKSVQNVVEKLAIGDVNDVDITINGKDELSEMALTVSVLANNMKIMAEYANKVGDGDFTAQYNLISDKDLLGKTLRAMTRKLFIGEKKLMQEIAKAEHSSHVKSQFLSTISHELRTPLNAIIGMTEVMLKENPGLDQIEYLNIIKFSALNLQSIISDILDFNKIDTRKIELEETTFNVKSFIKNLYISNLPKTQEKKLEFRINFDNIPDNILIIGDPAKLNQVLNNLVSNAVKFTSSGYVAVIVNFLDRTEDEVLIQFSVEDSGIGIADDKLDLIFKDFTQVEAETTRNYGGLGLGLTIAKGILGLFNTTISVKSSLNQGSIFSFNLKLKYVLSEEKRKSPIKALKQIADISILKGKHVLLVDDNKINLTVAQKVLQQADLEIVTACNGQDAIDKFSQNGPFDFVIMDLQMPVMDGYTASSKIRETNKEIPIIALSGEAMFDVEDKVKNAGMNDFIAKPFTSEKLLGSIMNFFK